LRFKLVPRRKVRSAESQNLNLERRSWTLRVRVRFVKCALTKESASRQQRVEILLCCNTRDAFRTRSVGTVGLQTHGRPLARRRRLLRRILLLMALLGIPAATASAQITPAAAVTPPDDTPSIRVGVTLYPTYTFQTEPKITDADGNTV